MKLSDFFEDLKIKPKNRDLFYEALTHSSFVNEKRTGHSYQRLEFVGDSLLDMAVAQYLYKQKPTLSEGEMTIIRSYVVNANALADLSLELGLDKLSRVGKGASELKRNIKFLSDLFESFAAAIYIDLGTEAFIEFMKKTIFKEIDLLKGKNLKNPKTILQEYLQSDSRGNIKYIVQEQKKIKEFEKFHVKVVHNDIILGEGFGKTIKTAEVEAAKDALKKWKGKDEIN